MSTTKRPSYSRLLARINEVADAINDTQNSLEVLQAAYDLCVAKHFGATDYLECAALTEEIWLCQETLDNLRYTYNTLVDLTF